MTIDSRLAYYDIFFYDHTGTKVLLLTRYAYLEYTQRLNDAWNYIIRLEYGPDNVDLLFFRNTLERDFILEVYRTDPLTETRTLVYEGLHRTLVDQIKQDGSVVLTLYGTGYTELLKRRIIIPPDGSETSDKTGVAETCIKDYVYDQAVAPVDSDRIIPGLAVEADDGNGNTATYSARYTNLFTAVSRLAEQGDLDFGVVRDTSVGTFLLRVKEDWGIDRRPGNASGEDGTETSPTVFDVTLNNMLIPILSKKGTNEINHIYIGGQGQGINRAILEMEDTAAEVISPWNRSEAFVDARNESTDNGLTTRGQAYLNDNQYTIGLSFNITQTEGTRWIRDWSLGDIIRAKYGSYIFSKKIMQVTVVLSAGDTGQAVIEVISAEMDDISNTPRAWKLGVALRSELTTTAYLGA
jgi:hypothetical protein